MIMKDYLPPNTPIVSNYLALEDLNAFAAFTKALFNAQLVKEQKDPQGQLLTVSLRIENAILSVHQTNISDEKATSSLLVYVESVEEIVKQAIEHGAQVIKQPLDNSFGERTACIKDQWGNLWWLASAIRN
ncbi:glyoxalase family protein [Vibrio ponticus]|nr:glyoxalase family protein [Vibrio ponticus]